QHWGECGAFAAEEFFADGERFAEEWPRLRFPCLAESPREPPKIEEGGGKLAPKAAIAARRDYCPAKGFDGGGLVPMSPCGARCIKPLGKQRFRVSHVPTLRYALSRMHQDRAVRRRRPHQRMVSATAHRRVARCG